MVYTELRIKTEEAIRLIYLYDYDSVETIVSELKEVQTKDADLAANLISIMLNDMKYGDEISALQEDDSKKPSIIPEEELEGLESWLKVLYMHLVLATNAKNDEIIEASKGDEEKSAYLLALYRASENNLFNEDDFTKYANMLLDAIKERYGENDWRYALALDYKAHIAYDLENKKEKGLEYIDKAYKIVKETYGPTSPYLIQILNSKRSILGAMEKSKEQMEVLKEAFSITSSLGDANEEYRDMLKSLAYFDRDNSYKSQFLSRLNAITKKYGELSSETITAYIDLAIDGSDDDKERENYLRRAYEISKEVYKDPNDLYLEVYRPLRLLLDLYKVNLKDEEKESDALVDFFSFLLPIYQDEAFTYFNKAFEGTLDRFGIYQKKDLLKRFLQMCPKDSPLYLELQKASQLEA